MNLYICFIFQDYNIFNFFLIRSNKYSFFPFSPSVIYSIPILYFLMDQDSSDKISFLFFTLHFVSFFQIAYASLFGYHCLFRHFSTLLPIISLAYLFHLVWTSSFNLYIFIIICFETQLSKYSYITSINFSELSCINLTTTLSLFYFFFDLLYYIKYNSLTGRYYIIPCPCFYSMVFSLLLLYYYFIQAFNSDDVGQSGDRDHFYGCFSQSFGF